jgi:hypothetical protein
VVSQKDSGRDIFELRKGAGSWSRDPQSARAQALFYSVARAKLLEANIKLSPGLIEEQIALFADVRQAWEQVDPARSQELTPVPAAGVSPKDMAARRTSSLDCTA